MGREKSEVVRCEAEVVLCQASEKQHIMGDGEFQQLQRGLTKLLTIIIFRFLLFVRVTGVIKLSLQCSKKMASKIIFL